MNLKTPVDSDMQKIVAEIHVTGIHTVGTTKLHTEQEKEYNVQETSVTTMPQ